MTPAAYARHRGISRQRVSVYIREGKITPDEDGLIDPQAADAELAENVDETKPKGTPKGDKPSSTGSIVRHRASREQVRLARERIELARLRGRLVDRDVVRRELFAAGRLVRDRLLEIPAQLAAELAAEPDPSKIRSILEERIRESVSSLSEQ